MTILICLSVSILLLIFFFNDTATTEIYTLSLHDALPIFILPDDDKCNRKQTSQLVVRRKAPQEMTAGEDRKSTRLNSSHRCISYAVFCLKKKIAPECEHDHFTGDRQHPCVNSVSSLPY